MPAFSKGFCQQPHASCSYLTSSRLRWTQQVAPPLSKRLNVVSLRSVPTETLESIMVRCFLPSFTLPKSSRSLSFICAVYCCCYRCCCCFHQSITVWPTLVGSTLFSYNDHHFTVSTQLFLPCFVWLLSSLQTRARFWCPWNEAFFACAYDVS